MDALGIFWLVLYSVIGVWALLKLKSTSTTTNQEKKDSHEPHSVKGITEGNERPSKRITFAKHICNNSSDGSNKKASGYDYKDRCHHSKTSIASGENDSQPNQNDTEKGTFIAATKAKGARLISWRLSIFMSTPLLGITR